MLIDSHCHLEPRYFPEGAAAVLERARASGVEGFVVVGVGEDLDPARGAIALAEAHGDVRAAIGVHPHDARVVTDAMADEIERMASSGRVVAVGEIGLDYHYMHSPREVQRQVFGRFIHAAKRLRKPIVVHTREAAAETLDILEAEGARDVGGIIHCFSEDLAFARRALDLDFDLSFSGIVTFRSARAIQEVAAWAPLDRIHVETDSPYLAPAPKRGKTCEPALVLLTAQRVADLRKMPLDELARATRENTIRRLRFDESARSA